MMDRELRKMNRRELQELVLELENSCDEAEDELEELEQENKTLRESLTQLGKTMKELRAKEEADAAAIAERDAALRDLACRLAEASEEKTDRGRLEEEVDRLYESFRQIKPILQEKDRQLQAAEQKIAMQEQTIRRLLQRGGPGDRI